VHTNVTPPAAREPHYPQYRPTVPPRTANRPPEDWLTRIRDGQTLHGKTTGPRGALAEVCLRRVMDKTVVCPLAGNWSRGRRRGRAAGPWMPGLSRFSDVPEGPCSPAFGHGEGPFQRSALSGG
jgi:hypothetical protein